MARALADLPGLSDAMRSTSRCAPPASYVERLARAWRRKPVVADVSAETFHGDERAGKGRRTTSTGTLRAVHLTAAPGQRKDGRNGDGVVAKSAGQVRRRQEEVLHAGDNGSPPDWELMEYACTDNNRDAEEGLLQPGAFDGSGRDGTAIATPSTYR